VLQADVILVACERVGGDAVANKLPQLAESDEFRGGVACLLILQSQQLVGHSRDALVDCDLFVQRPSNGSDCFALPARREGDWECANVFEVECGLNCGIEPFPVTDYDGV
jgi:hypothetical protein